MQVSYPASGWLPPGAHIELRQDDQGRDLATNWQGAVQAPGNGECIAVLSDRPFPNGFGPAYPVVRIDTGAWAGHEYYLGHTTAAVRAGDRFAFGHVLSHADQGHDWAGTTGGWVELGEAFGGLPGPKRSSHWFDPLIEKPLIVNVPDPVLRYGDKGWRVIGLSSMLKTCGYLDRLHWTFDQDVHGAVVAFKLKHRLPLPPLPLKPGEDRGLVDARIDVALRHARDYCKKHGREYP